MRVVDYQDDLALHPNDMVWLVLRQHNHHVRGMFVAPDGRRASRVFVGSTEEELRKRLATPRTLTALKRRFPSSTLVILGVESPVPSPLRSALRREWGIHYAGASDEPSPVP